MQVRVRITPIPPWLPIDPFQIQEDRQQGRDDRKPPPLPCFCRSHIPIQLMQKTGQIERTVDREFADEEARYRQYVPSPPSFPTHPMHADSKRKPQPSKKRVKPTWKPCAVRHSTAPFAPGLSQERRYDGRTRSIGRYHRHLLRCGRSEFRRCHGGARVQASSRRYGSLHLQGIREPTHLSHPHALTLKVGRTVPHHRVGTRRQNGLPVPHHQ